jgi:hypothetical protein
MCQVHEAHIGPHMAANRTLRMFELTGKMLSRTRRREKVSSIAKKHFTKMPVTVLAQAFSYGSGVQ